MNIFLLNVAKNLLAFWASKLINPIVITELIIKLAEIYTKRTKNTDDDELIAWLKKYFSNDDAVIAEVSKTKVITKNSDHK